MFIYHTNSHEIVAICKDDSLIVHLDEPYKKTFYDSPPMDVNYGFLLFDGFKFMENIPAYKEAQKEIIKQSFTDYLSSGYYDKISGITMDADILDVLKVNGQYDLTVSLSIPVSEVRDFYDQPHFLTEQELYFLVKSVGMHYSAALSRKSELQRQIDLLNTVAEIKAVVWSFSFDIDVYKPLLGL